MTDEPKQPPTQHPSVEASSAIKALAELFNNAPMTRSSGRRYRLERFGGQLVFRQTEIDAIIEAAINGSGSSRRKSIRRRTIKLPKD